MVTINFYQLNAFDGKTLLDLMELRQRVFVLEQHCLYSDIDDYDKTSIHGFIPSEEGNGIIACLRIIPPRADSQPVTIGRFAVAETHRGQHLGKQLFQAALDYCDQHFSEHLIEISAQQHLEQYYQSFGFETVSAPYDDVGIMHVKMVKTAISSRPQQP